jgi:hypothetical protein
MATCAVGYTRLLVQMKDEVSTDDECFANLIGRYYTAGRLREYNPVDGHCRRQSQC